MEKPDKIYLALIVLTFLVLAVYPFRSWGQSTERIGTVLATDGVAEVRTQGATEWERLRFRDAIFLYDTVRTGTNSKAKFLLHDDTIVTLNEQGEMEFTEFLVTPKKRRNVMGLLLGALKVVSTRIFGANSVTQVQTPNTVAGVRGTTFIVRFTPPASTDIFVLEGTVVARNLDPAIPNEEPVPANTRTSVVGSLVPERPVAIEPAQLQPLVQELNVTEQVPREVAPTEDLKPPETPRGEDAKPGTQGAAPPDSRTAGGTASQGKGTTSTATTQDARAASAPGPNGPAPGPNGLAPGPNGLAPGPNGPVPVPGGPMPGIDGPVPGINGPVPGINGPVPGINGPVPGINEPPQIGDEIMTPDTTPTAETAIEKSHANFIVIFPGQ